jgi:hypothetical protein
MLFGCNPPAAARRAVERGLLTVLNYHFDYLGWELEALA